MGTDIFDKTINNEKRIQKEKQKESLSPLEDCR